APHGMRSCSAVDAGNAACAGMCTGTAGTCTFPGGTTVCAPASCNGNTATDPSVCDGMGGCKPGATTNCPSGCMTAADGGIICNMGGRLTGGGNTAGCTIGGRASEANGFLLAGLAIVVG